MLLTKYRLNDPVTLFQQVKNLACDNPADEMLEQELEVLNDLNEERIRLAKLRSKDKASKEG